MAMRARFRSRFRRWAGLGVLFGVLCGWQGEPVAQAVEKAKLPPRIVPVDESPGHPAFHRFWRTFQRAVEDRDGKFILSVVADDIKLDFGGGAGRSTFIERWKPEGSAGPLWKELDEIIRLGGVLATAGEADLVFVAPYAFPKWPEGFDVFDHVFITGRDVRFRAKPSVEAKIIRKVSWEIMETDQTQGDWLVGDWARLKAHDGKIGFVHQRYVRSSVDFRIGFSDDGKGGFEMDFLIAGD